MRKPTRVAPEIHREIEQLANEYRMRHLAPNAAEIHRNLSARLTGVPTERTIRSIANARQVGDLEPWRVAHSSIDASLVLPTLAALVEHTAGGRKQLTLKEAELVAAIRKAVPGIDPLLAYYVAGDYIRAEREGTETALVGLDLLLAFAPWASDAARRRYEGAVAAGWVGPLIVSWVMWKSQQTVKRVGATLAAVDDQDLATALGVTAQRARDAEAWDRRERQRTPRTKVTARRASARGKGSKR